MSVNIDLAGRIEAGEYSQVKPGCNVNDLRQISTGGMRS